MGIGNRQEEVVKQLRWPSNTAQSDHMREMKALNIASSASNPNETWAAAHLSATGHRWGRQKQWGYRIFDFWNGALGCAVEIDGPEHDREYDAYRDEYNFRRSGIVVLRVRNRNQQDMERVKAIIQKLPALRQRKFDLGISGNSRAVRRSLSSLEYDKTSPMLQAYLSSIVSGRAA